MIKKFYRNGLYFFFRCIDCCVCISICILGCIPEIDGVLFNGTNYHFTWEAVPYCWFDPKKGGHSFHFTAPPSISTFDHLSPHVWHIFYFQCQWPRFTPDLLTSKIENWKSLEYRHVTFIKRKPVALQWKYVQKM